MLFYDWTTLKKKGFNSLVGGGKSSRYSSRLMVCYYSALKTDLQTWSKAFIKLYVSQSPVLIIIIQLIIFFLSFEIMVQKDVGRP